tara:strand:- start:422 stop:664 length:243 start_codon:yes stop_codon:yes gene_type:complete
LVASLEVTYKEAEMGFKFKLGEMVVLATAQEAGSTPDPSVVTALQLNGYIQIQPVGTSHRLLVEAKDYERFEEEIVELNG